MSRPTWRRTPSGDMQYRFGDVWFNHHRTYKRKDEAERVAKRLRAKGYKVRIKTRSRDLGKRTYTVCKKKK